MNRYALNVFPVLVVLFLIACSSQPSGIGSGGTSPESIVPVDVIHRAITLSDSGEMDAAVALLLDGTESAATDVEPLPSLGMSESDFRLLLGAKLESAQAENNRVADSTRALAREAAERVQAARSAGETEKADAWVARIDAMGRELTKDRYNALLQLIGPSVIKTAAKAKSL